ncbi:MAG TPA: hypothetical protein DEA08_16830 [Planctomycetes bacterium]|nr:hypothetical protein [Planctomycetota bacterium]
MGVPFALAHDALDALRRYAERLDHGLNARLALGGVLAWLADRVQAHPTVRKQDDLDVLMVAEIAWVAHG